MNAMHDQTDILSMLRESARDYSARSRDFVRLRERMGQPPGFDPDGFAQLQALGWCTALVPAEHGGAGLGLDAVVAVAEELGRGLLAGPYVATAVLPVALLQEADTIQARSCLDHIGTAHGTFAVAWQEAAEHLDCRPTLTARREGEGFALSGRKIGVMGVEAATDLLVSALTDEGPAVFRVPARGAGIVATPAWLADGTAAATLQLHDVRVGAADQVVPAAQALTALQRGIDAGAIAAGAEACGVARAAFEVTLDYLRTRIQFEQPIGAFQALQHKAVDLLIELELASAVLEEATAGFNAGADAAALSRLARRCKARCSDMALRVTRECIQLSGAIGYTHEYDLGLYLKRALVLAAWLGNGAQQRQQHRRALA